MSKSKQVTYGQTESADDLPVLIWGHEPSTEEIDAKYRELLPQEYEEVGFVNWKRGTAEVVQ
ncbi:hypothetical protein IB276_22375 [Ensifer sp. ENS04]|uniref:hypothetical protein n=1 Tax=Ensifer sp. ENS04 TaxID=2769281 RepID=UPI00178303F7|nr:hypothetical protein [Ensifer sp. ENS04]MBD9542194.1 hypothetical protein [Ensifer sp. ENS04]